MGSEKFVQPLFLKLWHPSGCLQYKY